MVSLDVNKNRYLSIDGLRAYGAIGIMSMHVMANGQFQLPDAAKLFISPMGEFVYLFMAISAFSLCCGYYDRFLNGSISIESFYRRRFAKIFPFFAVLCLIDLISEPSLSSLLEVFANLTLCFGLLPNPTMSVIGVGWFIGLIFVFYLIFPFFCFLLADKKRAWFAFLVALTYSIACKAYFFDENHVVAGYDFRVNILYCSVFFIGGGLVFLYRSQIENAPKLVARILLAIACVSYLCIALYGANTILLIPFVLSLLAYSARSCHPKWLVNRFSSSMSRISLEIYLCHMPVFRLANRLIPLNQMPYAAAIFLVAFGAVSFSCLFRYLERLMVGLSNKTFHKAN